MKYVVVSGGVVSGFPGEKDRRIAELRLSDRELLDLEAFLLTLSAPEQAPADWYPASFSPEPPERVP